jgi:predicted lipid-binding transport protein (Tim44 family)
LRAKKNRAINARIAITAPPPPPFAGGVGGSLGGSLGVGVLAPIAFLYEASTIRAP